MFRLRSRRHRGVFWGVVVVALLARHAAGQAPDPDVAVPPADEPIVLFRDRFDAFRYLFAHAGLQSADPQTFALAEPGEAHDQMLVVLGGELSILPLSLPLDEFVRSGGMVFIATDQTVPEALSRLRLWIVHGPVAALPGYLDNARLPIVDAFDKRHALFQGVSSLVFNEPGVLILGRDEDWTTARFPSNSAIAGEGRISRQPIVAARELEKGRIVVVADQGAFTNDMILENAGGNFRFAKNSLDWLTEGRDRARIAVLMLEDDDAVSQWIDPRFESGEWPSLPPIDLVSLANQFLAAVEDDHRERNTFNNWIESAQAELPGWPLAKLSLFVPTALLGLMVAWWWMRSRYTKPPGPYGKVLAIPWTALQRRREEIVGKRNFTESARLLSRHFFARSGGALAWEGPMPAVEVRGNPIHRWWRRWNLACLWRLAVHGPRRPVGRSQFRRLIGVVRSCEKELARGDLWFPGRSVESSLTAKES